ncbi:MAG: inorganic diphosphatase [Patescibacteria group bacterium]|nr:inorganic diphosphatase [Patescibacteria group bacterium]
MDNQNNLFHKLSPGPNPPKEIHCLVEISRGGSNKYEYDESIGVFKLDRALYGSVFYPTEYGFIPQTWGKDNDPLDVMVLSTFTTFPGCLLNACPIGLLDLIDSGEKDSKVISVASSDPRFKDTKKLEDLSSHFRKEITNFWQNYAELQAEKNIKIEGWKSIEDAYQAIEAAIKDYKNKFQ